jgi:hypothetical protein
LPRDARHRGGSSAVGEAAERLKGEQDAADGERDRRRRRRALDERWCEARETDEEPARRESATRSTDARSSVCERAR